MFSLLILDSARNADIVLYLQDSSAGKALNYSFRLFTSLNICKATVILSWKCLVFSPYIIDMCRKCHLLTQNDLVLVHLPRNRTLPSSLDMELIERKVKPSTKSCQKLIGNKVENFRYTYKSEPEKRGFLGQGSVLMGHANRDNPLVASLDQELLVADPLISISLCVS